MVFDQGFHCVYLWQFWVVSESKRGQQMRRVCLVLCEEICEKATYFMVP